MLTEQHVRATARALDSYIINGTGTGEPTGILNDADVSSTDAAAAAVDLDMVHASIGRLLAKGIDLSDITVALPAGIWTALTGEKSSGSGTYQAINVATQAPAIEPVRRPGLSSPMPSPPTRSSLGAFDYVALVTRDDPRSRLARDVHWDTDPGWSPEPRPLRARRHRRRCLGRRGELTCPDLSPPSGGTDGARGLASFAARPRPPPPPLHLRAAGRVRVPSRCALTHAPRTPRPRRASP